MLVRLKPGEVQNDRNLRIRLTGDGFVISPERTVELMIETQSDLLRMTPSVALEAGEYAFLSRSNMNRTPLTVRMFDFGVD